MGPLCFAAPRSPGDLADAAGCPAGVLTRITCAKAAAGTGRSRENCRTAGCLGTSLSVLSCVRPGFKHTGLFPEQAVNWDYAMARIKRWGKKPGGAESVRLYRRCLPWPAPMPGQASPMWTRRKAWLAWAKENSALNGLSDAPVRYIVDDALKFVKREQRRAGKYDGVIMDPPSFGHGPTGEMWK